MGKPKKTGGKKALKDLTVKNAKMVKGGDIQKKHVSNIKWTAG